MVGMQLKLGMELLLEQRLEPDVHATIKHTRDWGVNRHRIMEPLPPRLKELKTNKKIVEVYERYKESHPEYVNKRHYYGNLETGTDLVRLLYYMHMIQVQGKLHFGGVIYPSCEVEEDGTPIISLIAPKKKGHAWAHFSMSKALLVENGVLYYDDLSALCTATGHAVPGYYGNGRSNRFPRSFRASIKSLPEDLRRLPSNPNVAKKYGENRASYLWLRHLGTINSFGELDTLLDYLAKHAKKVGTTPPILISDAYVYESSAGPYVSLNMPSIGEPKVFLNTTLPQSLLKSPKELIIYAKAKFNLCLASVILQEESG